MTSRQARSICLFAFFLALAGFARPAAADPPARVGRVGEVVGVASFRAAGEAEWSPAALNEPVSSGAALWTEPAARLDIRIGRTALHMDGATEFDIDVLDDHGLQARLPQGALNLHIARQPAGDSYRIATPRGTVVVGAGGTYHIDAGSDAEPTRIAVLDGVARLAAEGASLTVEGGQQAVIAGTDPFTYSVVPARPTPFDEAALERDRLLAEPLPAERYVSPQMTGYEDLDNYGSWSEAPQYGAVWYPRQVSAGWAPYREGHWRWIEPWGWTWIDDEPWGFAPFHYGRWAFIDGRWGWIPGRLVAHPVYAPALVVFIGGGSWGAAPGAAPAVGWFPLAPHEVYVPSYPASVAYRRNINVTNVTNVTNIRITNVNVTNVNYVNRQFATVVPQRDFAASHSVGHAALHLPREAITTAPAARSAPVARAPSARSHASAEGSRPAAAPPHHVNLSAPQKPGVRPGAMQERHGQPAAASLRPAEPVVAAPRPPQRSSPGMATAKRPAATQHSRAAARPLGHDLGEQPSHPASPHQAMPAARPQAAPAPQNPAAHGAAQHQEPSAAPHPPRQQTERAAAHPAPRSAPQPRLEPPRPQKKPTAQHAGPEPRHGNSPRSGKGEQLVPPEKKQ